MKGQLGIKCNICGNDNWSAIDNPDHISIYCKSCDNPNSRICFIKQDFLDKFICENCGCPKGKMIENDDAIIIVCENCFEKYTAFNKPNTAIDNRNQTNETNNSLSCSEKIKCPKCGSTQITAGARGVNALWGFVGASKTVNRCMKCGHSWIPHK